MTNILALVERIAKQHVAIEEGRSSASLIGELHVEVMDTIEEPQARRTNAWFVFEFMVLFRAQSGSDSYYHHVFVGNVAIVDGQVLMSSIEHRLDRYVGEWEVEWAPAAESYDATAVRIATRDAWWREVVAARTKPLP